jgi:hypothetical protein
MKGYIYFCPVGRKAKEHKHEIHSDCKQGNPKCRWCKTPLECQEYGWGVKDDTPDEAKVVEMPKQKKDELDGFENPSEKLKGDIERMAKDAG